MASIYGALILAISAIAIVLAIWAVDRLDASHRGPGRVLWRPWYRTALVCCLAFVIGLLGGAGYSVIELLLVVYSALVIMQLVTGGAIVLQVLELFSAAAAVFLGMAIIQSAFPNVVDYDGRRDLPRAFLGIFGWSVLFAAVGVTCRVVRRIVTGSRMRR
jgi:hypothetical protein